MKCRVCDICDQKITRTDARYELYRGWLFTIRDMYRVDLCRDCSMMIGKLVKEKRKQEIENENEFYQSE